MGKKCLIFKEISNRKVGFNFTFWRGDLSQIELNPLVIIKNKEKKKKLKKDKFQDTSFSVNFVK